MAAVAMMAVKNVARILMVVGGFGGGIGIKECMW
jgi:hypothetical protein